MPLLYADGEFRVISVRTLKKKNVNIRLFNFKLRQWISMWILDMSDNFNFRAFNRTLFIWDCFFLNTALNCSVSYSSSKKYLKKLVYLLISITVHIPWLFSSWASNLSGVIRKIFIRCTFEYLQMIPGIQLTVIDLRFLYIVALAVDTSRM